MANMPKAERVKSEQAEDDMPKAERVKSEQADELREAVFRSIANRPLPFGSSAGGVSGMRWLLFSA